MEIVGKEARTVCCFWVWLTSFQRSRSACLLLIRVRMAVFTLVQLNRINRTIKPELVLL